MANLRVFVDQNLTMHRFVCLPLFLANPIHLLFPRGDEEGKGKAKRALNEETIAIGKESKANAIGKNLADMMPSADEVKPAKEKTRFWTTRAMLDKDTASTKEVVSISSPRNVLFFFKNLV